MELIIWLAILGAIIGGWFGSLYRGDQRNTIITIMGTAMIGGALIYFLFDSETTQMVGERIIIYYIFLILGFAIGHYKWGKFRPGAGFISW